MNSSNNTNKMAFQKENSYSSETIRQDHTANNIINDHSPTTMLTNLISQNVDNKDTPMTSSIASILDDSTPSDSGVQMIDSLSSSGLNESIISNSEFDFDGAPSKSGESVFGGVNLNSQIDNKIYEDMQFSKLNLSAALPDLVLPAANGNNDSKMVNNENNNQQSCEINDEMKTSTCSTFDTSENIVYRRKTKKNSTHNGTSNGPKKRVSFHEDILKNTKTDNIHIEHGFITYKGYNSKRNNAKNGRYSWCSEGDSKNINNCINNSDDCNNDDQTNDVRQYYYRNACSNVLDYGKTDCYDDNQYDNSGIFEYGPIVQTQIQKQQLLLKSKVFYKCNCSDSNSSLDSGDSCDNNRKRNYGQSKSSSCDCIESNNNNQSMKQQIADNCYFSEPNIETLDDQFEHIQPKSVWSKEKKPKSSCLKKGSRSSAGIIIEQDISKKVKKFNVHQLIKPPDMNNIIDNSKIILGSLKNIFAMPLPERGVPEGCEDLQSVYECLPEVHQYSPGKQQQQQQQQRTFLSKSFDGGLSNKGTEKPKKYIHNVDEQLRRNKNVTDTAAIMIDNASSKKMIESANECVTQQQQQQQQQESPIQFRNKYIINCESTVFEHTGVSYETDENLLLNSPLINKQSVAASAESSTNPLRRKLSSIFKSFRDTTATTNAQPVAVIAQQQKQSISVVECKPAPITQSTKMSTTVPNSMISSIASIDTTSSTSAISTITDLSNENSSMSGAISSINDDILSSSPNNKAKHLASPLKRKSLTTRITGTNYGYYSSPEKINCNNIIESKCLTPIPTADEFDDILTITTSDSDIVMLDYPSPEHTNISQNDGISSSSSSSNINNNFLRPSSASSSTTKSSLINRFLRNVTQKKIQDATIKKNTFLAEKIRYERKPFSSIYVKGVKPKNIDLIDDLNAEIALEMELSGNSSMANSLKLFTDEVKHAKYNDAVIEYGMGVGEIPVDVFKKHCLSFLRDSNEKLMKIFKLYTGYNLDGHMTPVLVFLTDRTLYVTNMIRNRLLNKFVLPYSELDVILIGPHGNTVLLSNGSRDMQQVLLAGGPYPADGLVSALEMCVRRAGYVLPSIGLLTLDHLASLQAFVRENSTVSKNDPWIYYAVVCVPTNLHQDEEPLGPNVKGPLMYQHLSSTGNYQQQQNWKAGYFLLKAGVLYMFNDSQQKLPNFAIALRTECKGVRRAFKSCRPHCFELMLKSNIIQLAAPDEYVASEWLQGLVQSASGLFELQDRHKTLGCTLILTSNHVITMREDFTAPLRRLNSRTNSTSARNNTMIDSTVQLSIPTIQTSIVNRKLSTSSTINTNDMMIMMNDTNSVMSNNSTKLSSDCHLSSNNSSPCRSNSGSIITTTTSNINDENSFSSMSSIYGKNAGIEIKSCAALQEISMIRIPAQGDNWWCILEFSCQEVRECTDDMVIFFATNSDMRRFLTMLETLWQTNNNDTPFPIDILPPNDSIGQHCSQLFIDINKSWDPLISAALGYPQ